jgi:23S rRNA (uracil1939-C5)-methyltransferase
MNPTAISALEPLTETPLCPVFGICGGCVYQDQPYEAELRIKEKGLKELLQNRLGLAEKIFEPITASPKNYHYRQRLDIALRRSKGEVLMGFQSPVVKRIVPIESCAIAIKEISDFIPQLREEAVRKFPADYRTANLVVRTGDDGRVLWGGIGRRSLELKEEDYLWTEIEGRRIFYSLETFFQANLSILPAVIQKLRTMAKLDSKTLFLDLYAGVGLFGICLAEQAGRVILVEDNPGSVNLAKYNMAYHKLAHTEIRPARVEEELPRLDLAAYQKTVAMIDPPRAGLSAQVAEALSGTRTLESLFYLSCHPESLVRDLEIFLKKGWKVEKVVPFDFFPRTPHLETLVLLKP